MSQTAHIHMDEILEHFDSLEDPRSTINRAYPLPSVLVIAVLAVLAGAGGPTAIAHWAAAKKEWLVPLLDLPNGVPCKDVFRRVLTLLRPSAFQACFMNWVQTLRAKAAAKSGIDQPILAIDGKTLRRSHDHAKELGALHSVSVWASDFGLSLGQVACGEKSNEITAMPLVLSFTDIKGAIVTIDAMGTQKAIAEQIVDGKADYVLALKGNQETLHEAVKDHITKRFESADADVEMQQHTTHEKGHGRVETRTYVQMSVPEDLDGAAAWKGLKTLGMVVSTVVRDDKETHEVRYYISSLAMDVKLFARAVRGHWGIENSCHWTLDMVFREDESRIREKNIRENFAWLNRFTLSLLKQHSGKDSLAMRRRCCGWSDAFLLEVITGQGT